jgi:membrane protease YdiL (CAAX protease family)
MDQPPSATSPRGGLRWWHGLLLFVAALGAQLTLIGVIIVVQVSGLLGSTPDEAVAALLSPTALTTQVVITSLVLVGLALVLPAVRRPGATATLGLARPRLGAALVGGLGIVPAGILVDELTFALNRYWPSTFDATGLDTFNQIFSGASTAGFAVVTLAVTIGPAVGEELFFRGLVLRAFLGSWPRWAAIGASALLFGMLHLDGLQGAGAALIGAYLGFVAVNTGSVWPGVLAHGLNNLLCSLLARLDPVGMGQAFKLGHPWWLVASAALLTAVALVILVRLSPPHPGLPPRGEGEADGSQHQLPSS